MIFRIAICLLAWLLIHVVLLDKQVTVVYVDIVDHEVLDDQIRLPSFVKTADRRLQTIALQPVIAVDLWLGVLIKFSTFHARSGLFMIRLDGLVGVIDV